MSGLIGWIRKRVGAPFRALSHQISQEVAGARDSISAELAEVRASLSVLRQQHGEIGRELDMIRGQIRSMRTEVWNGVPASAMQRYLSALNEIGVLNWQDDIVSGERRFLERFALSVPRPVVFDVGANIGGYTRLLRQLMPEATIHSFEPNPAAFAQLQDAAGTTGSIAHALALGEAAGQIEIFDYADETGSQDASIFREVIEGIHKRPAVGATVRCETLDNVTAQIGVDHLHLLKIDVLGNELAVMRGGARLLREKRIDIIQFGFNEMAVTSRVFFKDFFDVLEDFNLYRLLEQGVLPLPSYDPRTMEIFAYQNIACIRKDIAQDWII